MTAFFLLLYTQIEWMVEIPFIYLVEIVVLNSFVIYKDFLENRMQASKICYIQAWVGQDANKLRRRREKNELIKPWSQMIKNKGENGYALCYGKVNIKTLIIKAFEWIST